MYKRLMGLLLALLILAPVVQADPLVVYSGRKDKFVRPVVEAFTQATGIKVILHSGKSTELINKLRIEGSRTQADLFLSNDAGNLQKGSEMGLFQPVSSVIAEAIDPKLRAVDNSWIGLSARARVLVVNTQSKNVDFVRSVFDLADPRLKDRIAITHSANESFIAGTTVYMLKAGKEKTEAWLKGLKVNRGNQIYAKHSKVVKDVAAGRRDIGLVNHYYIYRHLDKHPDAPIRILVPDQGEQGMGVAWNVAGIAMSAHTRNKTDAERFIAFLVSPEGQKQFAEVNREYPARRGVAASAPVPAAGSYKVADVPMPELGTQRNATLDLIEAVGL